MKTHLRSPQSAPQIIVKGLNASARRGVLIVGSLRLPCALGRGGRTAAKREGDGATPIGRFALREVFYRPDRIARPRTGLPVRPIRPDAGWCDDPKDRNYNRPIRQPYRASAERLWRTDALYDLFVVIGYNDRPRILGRGSAIFMHVAGPGFAATEGCVALRRNDLRRVLELLTPRTRVLISP